MPKAELFQSVTQVVDHAREFIGLSAKTELLQNLTSLGHPYGLLLNTEIVSGPWLLCFSFSLAALGGSSQAINNSFPPSDERFMFVSTLLSKFGCQWLSLTLSKGEDDASSASSLDYKTKELGKLNSDWLNDPNTFKSRLTVSASLLAGSKMVLTKDKTPIDPNERLGLVALAPTLKAITELGERPRNLWVGKNQLGLGSSSIHLGTYHGETPYLIKSPQGEVLTHINPGDQVGSVHVASQAGRLRELSPLEKVEQITRDFIDLLKAIENGGNVDLTERQQKTIDKARTATFVGISHLVRIFGRRTGLPTWKLDALPPLVQRFHQHDSQAVSRAFGGSRKVKASDVEMMVITPEMRRQLVATV